MAIRPWRRNGRTLRAERRRASPIKLWFRSVAGRAPRPGPPPGHTFWGPPGAAGTHSIVATYSGDAANAGSASPPLSQAIASKTTSTTTLASSLNPSTVGARVVFTAGVTGKAPTGTVAFTDGTNTISKCAAVA